MEKYHEYFHLLFGLVSALIVLIIFPDVDIIALLFWAIVASFLPDSDHLLAIYVYARSTSYATAIRAHLGRLDIIAAIDHIRRHHKSNHFILSHNLLTPAISFFLFGHFLKQASPQLSVFCPVLRRRINRRRLSRWK